MVLQTFKRLVGMKHIGSDTRIAIFVLVALLFFWILIIMADVDDDDVIRGFDSWNGEAGRGYGSEENLVDNPIDYSGGTTSLPPPFAYGYPSHPEELSHT